KGLAAISKRVVHGDIDLAVLSGGGIDQPDVAGVILGLVGAEKNVVVEFLEIDRVGLVDALEAHGNLVGLAADFDLLVLDPDGNQIGSDLTAAVLFKQR